MNYDIKIGFAYYTNHINGKNRPLLIFQDREVNRVAIWRITSQFQFKSKYYQQRYFPLFHWRDYNLKKPSFVDITSKIILTNQQYQSLPISKRPAISSLSIRDQIQFIQFVQRRKHFI